MEYKERYPQGRFTAEAEEQIWRLPTDKEWKELAQSFGGYYDYEIRKDFGDPKKSYKALLEEGISGFAALLGGWRDPGANFNDLEVSGDYWSGTQRDTQFAWYYNIYSSNGKLYRYYHDKSLGHSCRCIQSTPSNGTD